VLSRLFKLSAKNQNVAWGLDSDSRRAGFGVKEENSDTIADPDRLIQSSG
jgi:hypothetical protein